MSLFALLVLVCCVHKFFNPTDEIPGFVACIGAFVAIGVAISLLQFAFSTKGVSISYAENQRGHRVVADKEGSAVSDWE